MKSSCITFFSPLQFHFSNLLTTKLAQNGKCPVLPQSCAVCRRGLLVPRARADHLPVPFDPEPCGTTLSRWTNGHPLRGFGTTSHQAPCGDQHRAVQKAGLPCELQASRTPENEFVMLSCPPLRALGLIGTCLQPFGAFYPFVSKIRSVALPNINRSRQCWSQMFQQSIVSSFSWTGLDDSPHVCVGGGWLPEIRAWRVSWLRWHYLHWCSLTL